MRTQRSLRGVIEFIQRFSVLVSVFLLAVGTAFTDFNIILFAVFCLFVSNIVYGCLDIHERLFFLAFHFGIFLFLLTRPLIDVINGSNDWLGSSIETTFFILMSIYVSLFCLLIGNVVFDAIARRRFGKESCGSLEKLRKRSLQLGSLSFSADRTEKWMYCLRTVSGVVFVACITGTLILGLQMLSFVRANGLTYEEYSLTVESDYSSSLIINLNAFMPYALLFYLAAMPKKRPATIALLLYVASTLLWVVVGKRTEFVTAALMLAAYYLIRNFIDTNNKWVGRREVLVCAVVLPLGILFMGLLNYVRGDSVFLSDGGALALLSDSLYKQGITFKILGWAYDVNPAIQALGFKGYTFGSLVSSITQGVIGQNFFDFKLLPETNSVDLAINGSRYAQTMAYFAHSNYLGGESYGSSYILELFTDFGFAGIIGYSLLLGFLFAWLSRKLGANWFLTAIGLVSLRYIYHVPRGEALEWLAFLWSTRFWMIFLAVVGLAALFYVSMGRSGLVARSAPVNSQNIVKREIELVSRSKQWRMIHND